jgi:hypothetical protein
MNKFVTTLGHWIATRAERYAEQGLESIHHKLDKWLLSEAHCELDAKKAAGIDGVTKEIYGQALNAHVDEIVRQVRSRTYRAPPVRHTEIDSLPPPFPLAPAGCSFVASVSLRSALKPDGSTRPLGIPTYEDSRSVAETDSR